MRYLLLLIFLILPCLLQAQVIYTIAGPGNKINNCIDTGGEMLSMLTNPIGITIDDNDNGYIAEYFDVGDLLGSIVRFKPYNPPNTLERIITKRGRGDNAQKISYPHGIAVDHSGNVYVAEYNAHTVRRITRSGNIILVAGSGSTGYSGDKGDAVSARLSLPNGVAADNSGNLFIADEYNHAIRKVNNAGIISTYAGNGTEGYSGDGGPATRAKLNKPYGVTADNVGNVYFADAGNNVIRKVSIDGFISTVAGNGTKGYSGDGGLAIQAELNKPAGIAIDTFGNLYIADEGNDVIRKVDVSGMISTVAGNGRKGYRGDGGLATAAELSGPRDVATDRRGNLYIVDFGNHVIRKVIIPPPVVEVAAPKEPVPVPSPAPQPQKEEDKVAISVTTDNILTITTEKVTYTSFTITSMSGEKMIHEAIKAKQTKVDVKKLPPGQYYITLKAGDKNKVLYFVKEN